MTAPEPPGEPEPIPCDGSYSCPAETHILGCYRPSRHEPPAPAPLPPGDDERLVRELRGVGLSARSEGGDEFGDLMDEAAAAIERLTATAPVLPPGVTLQLVERLIHKLDRWHVAIGNHDERHCGSECETFALLAEARAAVRPPEPPAEPRTERVPALEALHEGRIATHPGGPFTIEVLAVADDGDLIAAQDQEDGKAQVLRSDGTVEVLALGDTDA